LLKHLSFKLLILLDFSWIANVEGHLSIFNRHLELSEDKLLLLVEELRDCLAVSVRPVGLVLHLVLSDLRITEDFCNSISWSFNLGFLSTLSLFVVTGLLHNTLNECSLVVLERGLNELFEILFEVRSFVGSRSPPFGVFLVGSLICIIRGR